jgi:hypothetical protein
LMMRREYIQLARNIWPGIAFQEVISSYSELEVSTPLSKNHLNLIA